MFLINFSARSLIGKNGDSTSTIILNDLQNADCGLFDDTNNEQSNSKIVLRDADGDERCVLSICERKG